VIKPFKNTCFRIEPVQAISCGNPQKTLMVFGNGKNLIIADRLRVFFLIDKFGETDTVEPVQAAVISPDPDKSFFVLIKAAN
jgi:hypothetical protein